MSYNLSELLLSELLSKLDAKYGGRPETARRIKAYREQHGGTLAGAIEALAQEQDRVTPSQVRTVIMVLRASVAEQLGHLDTALLDELADAIDIAAYGPIPCEIDVDPPLDLETVTWARGVIDGALGGRDKSVKPLPQIKGYRWKIERVGDWPHAGSEYYAYLITPGGTRIAMLTTILYADHVLLRFLFVHRDFRQRGLGSKMLKGLLTTYTDLPIRLKVEPDNDDMPLNTTQLAAWYGRFGFMEDTEPPWMVRPIEL